MSTLMKEQWEVVIPIQRTMYTTMSEVYELTDEMLDAVKRQDRTALRMYLKMRQDVILKLCNLREKLESHCNALPPASAQELRDILSGKSSVQDELAPLCKLVAQNQHLFQRTIQADQQLNQMLAGKKSFYLQK